MANRGGNKLARRIILFSLLCRPALALPTQAHSSLHATSARASTTVGVQTPAHSVKRRLRGGQNKFSEASVLDIAYEFLPLGCTAFGGPAAHIALFEKVFVQKLGWLPHSVFVELFALGQCLPGPASTQVAIAIGTLKQGVLGGLVAGLCFILPGMLMLTMLGMCVHTVGARADNPVFKGFCAGVSAAGVSLVARAAINLSRVTSTSTTTQTLNGLSALIAYLYSRPTTFPLLILAGGVISIFCESNPNVGVNEDKNKIQKHPARDEDEGIASYGMSKTGGACLLCACPLILAATFWIESQAHVFGSSGIIMWFARFFRVGSIILGGGQVVLPLLMTECIKYTNRDKCAEGDSQQIQCKLVPDYEALKSLDLSHPEVRSWLREDEFLTGLGLAQGMPGPLFNLSAYLGAVIASRTRAYALIGACTTWIGLFLPAFMLIFGALPWWGEIRQFQMYKRAMPGMNACAAGLVVAAVFALYDRVRANSPFPDDSVAIGMGSFIAVEVQQLPAPFAIFMAGCVGALRTYA